MKIVALWGASNVGKTTTIKKLMIKIMDKYGDDCLRNPSHHITKQMLIDEIKKERINKPLNSKSPVRNFYTKFEIEGHIFGITTAGDNMLSLLEAFKIFGGCELCFCATHKRGKTVSFVEDMAKDDLLLWYEQCKISSNRNIDLYGRYEKVNDKIADLLFAELQNYLSK